ncbi:MAG TPA: GNAT family N-acetyltransferase [Thermoleophilaceae bacterium]|nr:GNAT family N-acetyltransferase [Thermoleophilaceae bacterium]
MSADARTARAWRAGPDEAEAVARLVVGFRDHMGKGWPSENAMLAGVERLMEDPATVYLLAAPDDDSPPAGYAQLRFRHSLWTAAPDCWIEDVFVEESARRRGVADALVAMALDAARARGARRAELDTSEANEAARALYARHGFSESSKGESSRDLFLGVKLPD